MLGLHNSNSSFCERSQSRTNGFNDVKLLSKMTWHFCKIVEDHEANYLHSYPKCGEYGKVEFWHCAERAKKYVYIFGKMLFQIWASIIYVYIVDNVVRLIWPRSDNLTFWDKSAKSGQIFAKKAKKVGFLSPGQIFTTRQVRFFALGNCNI